MKHCPALLEELPFCNSGTMCQIWLFILAILLSALPVLSSTKDESAEIGSCPFDKTSLAMLSCIEPNGKWRPPSVTCCSALLHAIDHLPANHESGGCCLCRYLKEKYPAYGVGVATSYALCQGKDRHIVSKWSFPLQPCYKVCRPKKGASESSDVGIADHPNSLKDLRDVHVHGRIGLTLLRWMSIVASFAILLVCCWYYKPVAKRVTLNAQRQGSSPIGAARRPARRLSTSPQLRTSSSVS